MKLTSLNRCAEDIRAEAIIVAELKLHNVKWHTLLLILWNAPITPRLMIDQKPSIVLA
jgi:hypothetical protein